MQVIQGAAVATLVLNASRCGSRRRGTRARRTRRRASTADFRDAWATFIEGDGTRCAACVAIGLGTMAFGMQDVLLEPYGGQVLRLTVGATTKLTATLARRRPDRLRAGLARARPRRRSLPHGRHRRAGSAFRPSPR